MATRTTTLSIRVLVEAAQGASELRNLGNSAGGVGDKFQKLVAIGAAFAGVTAFIKSAVDSASKLQQSMGGVEAVFKGSAAQVKAWGANAADSVGLSQSAYQDLATLIGSQLKNAGTAMEDLAPKTDELIRQGADLAAMYGGTTAEAVGALSSALKGERDPIEKYGISLNDAAIKAEIMALGLDTSTAAAEQAAKATATLSLITKQSADAHGAAAREADSYASVMQRLSATWDNALAAIGTALLPALSGLGDAFTNLIPLVAAVLTPVAELLGWILQLPGPVLAAAAAFAAWQLFGGSISAGLATFTERVKTATTSMGSMRSALGGIASSLAGGLAFAGVAVAVMVVAQAFQRTAEAAKTATQAYQPVVDALVASQGAWSDTAAAAQNAAILQSEGFKGLVEAGFSAADAVRILLGTQEEWIAIQSDGSDSTRNLTKDTTAAVDSMIDANGAAGSLAQAQLDGMAAMQQNAAATGSSTAATQANAEATQKAAEEQAKAAVESAKYASENTAVKTALDSVAAAGNAASTAVQFFVLQMQAASGNTASLDQAAALMNSTLRDTAAAFKGTAEDGGYSMAALTDWNVAALTSTERGDAIYQSLLKQQTAYATSTTAAYSNAAANGDTAAGLQAAAGAADTAYAAFIAMATEATGSSVAAEQLAAKLGIVQGTNIDPKTFQLIADDQQADAALAAAQAAEIATKNFDVNATVAPAQAAVSGLEQQDLTNTLNVDANTKNAQSQLQSTADQKRTATIQTDTNVAPATSQLNALTSQARDTTIQVQANTTPAQSAITALVTQQRTLTITVNANTSSAESSINSIVNRSYTATVNVTANVSAARAAIASIPTVAPAVAAAPMAARGAAAPAALAAPAAFAPAPYMPLHAVAAPAAAPAEVTNNITIHAGLGTDPDSLGRAVRKVLTDQERRSTTVIAR